MKKNIIYLFFTLLLLVIPLGMGLSNDIPIEKYKPEYNFDYTHAPIDFTSLFTFLNDFPSRYEEFFSVSIVKEMSAPNHGLASADFNNDGLLDVAASTYRSESISIFYNLGDNEFNEEIAVQLDALNIPWPVKVQEGISDLDAADYDGDDDIDLIFTTNENKLFGNVAYNWNGTGILLLNDGTNHFSEWRQVFLHQGEGSNDEMNRINPVICSGDYDQDGAIDFLVGDNSGKVSFYANDGTGNFSFVVDSDFGSNISWGLDSADFDGDGDLDIICTQHEVSMDTCGLYIKWNHGGNTCFDHDDFQKIVAFPINSSFYTSLFAPANFGCIQCIDYNGDGRMDFLFGERGFMVLFVQKGNYHFDSYGVCSFSMTNDGFGAWAGDNSLLRGDIAVGDFDGDGLDDAIVGGDEGVIRCFRNQYMLADITRIDSATVTIVFDKVRYPMWPMFVYPMMEYGTTMVIGDVTIPVKNLSVLNKVEFFVNNKLMFIDDQPPFEWNWTSPGFGRYVVKAVPYDVNGKRAGFDEELVVKLG